MFIKPADGLRVLYENAARVLPPEGAEVEPSFYWGRFIARGDVQVVEEDEASPVEQDPPPAPPAADMPDAPEDPPQPEADGQSPRQTQRQRQTQVKE